MKTKIQKEQWIETLEKQVEYFDTGKWSDHEWNRDIPKKKIPLKLIPELDTDIILSLVDWKSIREKHPNTHKDSTMEELGDMLIDVIVDLHQYFGIDGNESIQKRGRWYIFEDQNDLVLVRQDRKETDFYFVEALVLFLEGD